MGNLDTSRMFENLEGFHEVMKPFVSKVISLNGRPNPYLFKESDDPNDIHIDDLTPLQYRGICSMVLDVTKLDDITPENYQRHINDLIEDEHTLYEELPDNVKAGLQLLIDVTLELKATAGDMPMSVVRCNLLPMLVDKE